jgi:hypothetical protein
VAHSDYSAGGALLKLEASFPGQGSYFEDKEFDMHSYVPSASVSGPPRIGSRM